MNALTVLPALALLAGMPSTQVQVWVVDQFGTGDFTTIQPAIDAAAPGETILVRHGEYPAFLLAKELTISAVQDADVHVDSFSVSGISSGGHAVVRGLKVDQTVTVFNNAGIVVLQELERTYFLGALLETPALRILDSEAVVLNGSELWGGEQPSSSSEHPGAGLEMTGSTLYVHGSIIRGGNAAAVYPFGEGGPGATLDDAFLYLADSTLRGGQGTLGYGEFPACTDGQDGGPGIAFVDTLSEVQWLDATIEGGPGGYSSFSCFGWNPGDQGPMTVGTGTLGQFTGNALALHTPRTIPQGADVDLALSGGPAGAVAFLGMGSQPLALFLPNLFGALLIDGPYSVVGLGALDSEGKLNTSIPGTALSAGDEALQLHLQAGYLSPGLEIVLGAPAEVTVTDVPPLGKTVWTVGGGGDFSTLWEAVAFVEPGSTLLVRAGSYSLPGAFQFEKPLTITAEAGQEVGISDRLTIANIPAGERFVLAGIDCLGLGLLDCEGIIWVEDVAVATSSMFFYPAFIADGCHEVVLVNCTALGPTPTLTESPPGLFAHDSTIYLHGSRLEGGRGLAGFLIPDAGVPAGNGGPGAYLDGTFLMASGTSFVGGTGGAGVSDLTLCAPPGDGGYGLVLAETASDVWLLDSSFTGGPGGVDPTPGGLCQGQQGASGSDLLNITGSSLSSLGPDAALALATSSPVRDGALLDVKIAGPRDAPVFLALGDGPAGLFLQDLTGAILVAPPYVVLALGFLDGTGTLDIKLPLPPLPWGIDQKHYFGQVGYVNGSGAVILGAPADVLQIASSY